ncbi:hypothetical protein NP493_11g06009 [Ridgeia piscesae]|uniref:Ig-like domain-containing protein n=1 Tax=Ridgeia piscesae TaxID=27915 RepID=A0AAD9PFF8_RIDPI|nr:hypothetical protein NP493_11g06009 [Ridgeia piscesae]
MSCRNNLTKNIVQEGDVFEFSCTVAFYGNSQPHLQWSDSFGDITHRRRLSRPSSYDNNARTWASGKTFTSIHVRALRSLHGYVYRCLATYPMPNGHGMSDVSRATNVPIDRPGYHSDPLVVYCKYCTTHYHT